MGAIALVQARRTPRRLHAPRHQPLGPPAPEDNPTLVMMLHQRVPVAAGDEPSVHRKCGGAGDQERDRDAAPEEETPRPASIAPGMTSMIGHAGAGGRPACRSNARVVQSDLEGHGSYLDIEAGC